MAQRSRRQNNSMHKYFALVADALNEQGITPRRFVKEDMPIRWSWQAVKTHFSGLYSSEFKDMPQKHQKAACKAIARTFNAVGLDMRAQLPENADLIWDKDLVKENIWRPVQQTMYEKKSTTQLNRSEVNEIYKMVAARLADRFGIDIEFPSDDDEEGVPLRHETAQRAVEEAPDGIYEINGEPKI